MRVVEGIRQKRLGGSDMYVSEVGLGTQRWVSGDANAPTKRECFDLLDYAVEHGVNLVDTAESYPIPSTDASPEGAVEQVLGAWMNLAGAEQRDSLIIASKVTGGQRISRKGIIDAVDGSLKRLGEHVLGVCV